MRRLASLALAFTLAGVLPASAAPASDPIGDLIKTVLGAPAVVGDWAMKATLYHAGASGVGNRDARGCRPTAMRTAAVDRKIAPLGSVLFIPETVGVKMPDGKVHDGYWYASDTGGAIKGEKIDLYTGSGSASMRPLMALNLATLTVKKVGSFTGCPADQVSPTTVAAAE